MGDIWGSYKGERGYWTTKRGKTVFVAADKPVRRRSDGLQVIKDCEPFQNIAIDNGIIGGKKQRRDMMRAHGLEEVGTQKPPEMNRVEQFVSERSRRPDRQIVELLKKNSGGKWL